MLRRIHSRDDAWLPRTHASLHYLRGSVFDCVQPILLFHLRPGSKPSSRDTASLFIFCFLSLLLSGAWHTKLWLLNDGQFTWSNHAGSNLAMAWQPVVDTNALSAVLLSPRSLVAVTMRWADLNTDVHRRNSEAKQHAVLEGVIGNPGLAIELLGEKVLRFMSVPTQMYQYQLRGPLITAYQWLGRFLFVGLLRSYSQWISVEL